MGTSLSSVRVARSVRFMLAMFQLIAEVRQSLVRDFGRAVLDMLKKQYPDQTIGIDPATVGNKMLNIAKKQNQYDEQRSIDAIQDFLTYLVSKDWNFAKDFPKWEDALGAIYSNIRLRAMSKSIEHQKSKKRTKGIEEAYGKRPEGGGAPEGGEARMPTDPESALGKALDDQAAIKEFVDLIDEHLADLRATLSDDSRKLFDLIFDDNVGSFGSDIKENMGQASALKEKHPELYEKNAKRWSGFVGDLRKKLLDEIWNYIDKHMTQDEYEMLRDMFFSDVDPSRVREQEKKKVEEKKAYQRGIDERKISRFKWQEQQGPLSDKDKKSFEALKAKLKKEGVDVDAIPAEKDPGKGKPEEGLEQVAARVAGSPCMPFWM